MPCYVLAVVCATEVLIWGRTGFSFHLLKPPETDTHRIDQTFLGNKWGESLQEKTLARQSPQKKQSQGLEEPALISTKSRFGEIIQNMVRLHGAFLGKNKVQTKEFNLDGVSNRNSLKRCEPKSDRMKKHLRTNCLAMECWTDGTTNYSRQRAQP